MNYTDTSRINIESPVNNIDTVKNVNRLGKLSGLELRLLPPYIKNNRTLKLWPFPGYSSLYCFTIVISDVQDQFTGHMGLNAFHKVGDHEFLPIEQTIYYWLQKRGSSSLPPQQLHVMCTVIKSKERLRDIGKLLSSLKKDKEYDLLSDQLGSLISGTTTINVITNLALKIVDVMGDYLGSIDDKPLGMMMKSFTTLHGDWDKPGTTNHNVKTKDVDFNLELIAHHSPMNLLAFNDTLGKKDMSMISLL